MDLMNKIFIYVPFILYVFIFFFLGEPDSSNPVQAWLESINLGFYWQVFQNNSYDLMETIISLDGTALTDIGITKIGHRNLILSKAIELKK